MRPLPRLLAVTDDAIVADDDFGIRAAAIAAAGPGVAIVVRAPATGTVGRLGALDRVRSLTRPPGAAVIAHGDPALGRMAGAQGVQLRAADLTVADARGVLGTGWIGVSVHDAEEASVARSEGADYVVAGNVFATTTHPDRPGRGLAWLAGIVDTGIPVFAIGGITADRTRAVADTGAWGVAAIDALWRSPDSARATEAILATWGDR